MEILKQTFNEALSRLFREAKTYQKSDVLTCCRTVVYQYCRIELLTQTGKAPMKQTYELSIQQRITDKNHSIFNQVKKQ